MKHTMGRPPTIYHDATWTPEQKLLAAVIRRAVFDLIYHTGYWQRSAARYFASGVFVFDCQSLDVDALEFLQAAGLLGKIKSVLNCKGVHICEF